MEKVDKKLVGQRIRRLRKEMGLTLKEVAGSAGISIGFLADIEKGRAMPSAATLDRLATALQSTTDYLLGRAPLKHLRETYRDDNRVEFEADPSDTEAADEYRVTAANKEKTDTSIIERGLEELVKRVVARELARRQKKDGETV